MKQKSPNKPKSQTNNPAKPAEKSPADVKKDEKK